MGTGLMGWLLDTVYLRTKIIVSMKVNFQIFQRVVKVIKNFQMEMNMKGASWKDCLTGKVSIFGKTEWSFMGTFLKVLDKEKEDSSNHPYFRWNVVSKMTFLKAVVSYAFTTVITLKV